MTLYVSDLDGTLLDEKGALSDRTREGLTRLLSEGLLFTVASARHVSSIASILGDLPLKLPVISTNEPHRLSWRPFGLSQTTTAVA